jgi:glycolate oxidase FAD binding subunit
LSEVYDAWRPADAAEAAAMLAEANAKSLMVTIRGGGSKGPGPAADRVLDMTGLSGVETYEPGELVLRAHAGTPVAEVEALLADQGQRLAFEPPDLGPLFGGQTGKGTLGGMVAAGLSGPRRIAAGAVRDHLLGFDAVNGKGEVFRAGGPVVKNVTGYDLPKLMAGSWGTLAALTSVTLKVLPKPKTSMTLRFAGLRVREACRAMSLAMGGPWSVSGAAVQADEMLLRLEGFQPSVQARAAGLRTALAEFGRAELVTDSEDIWRAIRNVSAFAGPGPELWRLSGPPADGWKPAEALVGTGEMLMDWAGGLLWMAGDAADPSAVVQAWGGHARLVRGGPPQRADGRQTGVAQLSARVKTAFDPAGVLVGRL